MWDLYRRGFYESEELDEVLWRVRLGREGGSWVRETVECLDNGAGDFLFISETLFAPPGYGMFLGGVNWGTCGKSSLTICNGNACGAVRRRSGRGKPALAELRPPRPAVEVPVSANSP